MDSLSEFTICQMPGKAYDQSLETRIVSCSPASALLDRFGKHKPTKGTFLDVVLKDTILFAEGGGQPCDFGNIEIVGSNASSLRLEVVDVFPGPAGAIIHRVRAAVEGQDASQASALGEGAAAVVRVDWDRRYDHMQQHTGQHALSAVAEDHLGLKTVGWSLGPDRCYVDLDRPASPEALREMEARVAAEIRRAAAVSAFLVSSDELDQVPGLRTRNLKATGPIRLVRIEGLDVNTCCGTHLSNLAEVQALKIVASESVRGGSRVSFVAGGRVYGLLEALVLREQQTTKLLSCGGDQHVTRIEELKAAVARESKGRRALLKEVSESLGRALAAEEGAAGGVHFLHRDDAEGGDAGFLNDVAGAALAARGDVTLLLTMGSDKEGGVFLLRGPAENVKRLSPTVAAGLETKGGGRPGFYQGKCEGKALRPAALEALHRAVSAAAAAADPSAQ